MDILKTYIGKYVQLTIDPSKIPEESKKLEQQYLIGKINAVDKTFVNLSPCIYVPASKVSNESSLEVLLMRLKSTDRLAQIGKGTKKPVPIYTICDIKVLN